MHNKYLAVAGLIVFLIASCKKEQQIPSYLHVGEIAADGVYSISGTDSSKIYGAKIFLNNQLIGVYQTPVELPVFAEGKQSVKVQALIEKNGFFDDLIPYPFFDLSEYTVIFTADSTSKISPVVKYLSTDAVDYWFDDFENPSSKFVLGANSTGEMDITNDPAQVYEGAGSLEFDLNQESSYIKALTETGFTYKKGTNAFVELNYKNNQPFFFDLVIHYQSGQTLKIPFFQFKETIDENGNLYWNKIYLEIGSTLHEQQQMESFDICFEMQRENTISNPVVLVDNVKVIKNK